MGANDSRDTDEGLRHRASTARGAAGQRAAEARDAAQHRVAGARAAAGERLADARESTEARVADAKAAAGEAIERVKPRLRGVLHQWAFFAALVAGAVLVALAPEGRATLAASIYAGSLAALLGTSALYHRVNWRRPAARQWMRRLDHSMIFLLIAGTVTPFALLVMDGPFATALLVAVWVGAFAGIVVELIWIEAPKWATALVYVAVGWIGALGFPAIVANAGIMAGVLIAVGGVMYMTGAIVYARQRPDPNPAVFGYHEIFHLLVIAAAALHFAAVAIYAVPAG